MAPTDENYLFNPMYYYFQIPLSVSQSYDFTAQAEKPEPAFTTTASYSTFMSQNGDDVDIYYPVPDDSASHKFPVALFFA